jgi:hypothetical protein
MGRSHSHAMARFLLCASPLTLASLLWRLAAATLRAEHAWRRRGHDL